VEDARLAPYAVERSRWFTKFMSVNALVWCVIAGLFAFAALTSHKNIVWVLFGWSLLLIVAMLLMRRRYGRSYRANLELIAT
jgi:hypothetical protein